MRALSFHVALALVCVLCNGCLRRGLDESPSQMHEADAEVELVAECLNNADCGDLQRCVEGVCYNHECVHGAEQTCQTACGVGVRLCVDGVWRACSAQIPQNERCDTLEDEDCDGVVDEGCDRCEFGAIEVACSPGEEQQEACASCGQRTRSCTDSCQWGPWGICDEAGTCEPGAIEYQPCGNSVCATQERVCNDQCEWGEFGACIGGGFCDPSEPPQTRSCGSCGVQSRSCEASCGWGDWSVCEEPLAACVPGEVETVACGETSVGLCMLGERQRTCTEQCEWGGWGLCDGVVIPTIELCGSGLDENCDGYSETRPDSYEPNNTCEGCYSIDQQNPVLTIYATIDNVNDDWDYYCVQVSDTFSAFGDEVKIDLTNIPSGADYDVYLYKEVEGCNARNEVDSSVNGSNSDEELRWNENQFSDDSGTYVIGVKQVGNRSYHCDQAYVLSIDFDI